MIARSRSSSRSATCWLQADGRGGPAWFPEGEVDLVPRVPRVDGHELMPIAGLVQQIHERPRIKLGRPYPARMAGREDGPPRGWIAALVGHPPGLPSPSGVRMGSLSLGDETHDTRVSLLTPCSFPPRSSPSPSSPGVPCSEMSGSRSQQRHSRRSLGLRRSGVIRERHGK